MGELEMRNDSIDHYQEVRFNMLKRRTMEMLYSFSKESKNYSDNIIVYDAVIKRFGNWEKLNNK